MAEKDRSAERLHVVCILRSRLYAAVFLLACMILIMHMLTMIIFLKQNLGNKNLIKHLEALAKQPNNEIGVDIGHEDSPVYNEAERTIEKNIIGSSIHKELLTNRTISQPREKSIIIPSRTKNKRRHKSSGGRNQQRSRGTKRHRNRPNGKTGRQHSRKVPDTERMMVKLLQGSHNAKHRDPVPAREVGNPFINILHSGSSSRQIDIDTRGSHIEIGTSQERNHAPYRGSNSLHLTTTQIHAQISEENVTKIAILRSTITGGGVKQTYSNVTTDKSTTHTETVGSYVNVTSHNTERNVIITSDKTPGHIVSEVEATGGNTSEHSQGDQNVNEVLEDPVELETSNEDWETTEDMTTEQVLLVEAADRRQTHMSH